MIIRKAQENDIPRIAALIGADRSTALSNAQAAIESQTKRDNETGQFEWLLSETGAGVAVARIAVIAPPPIYDLKGGLAGVVLDTWQVPSIERSTATCEIAR